MSLLLMTIGGSGMYSITVVLPGRQQDFGVARGAASLPYTLTMVGFGVGGILLGRLADRHGIAKVVLALGKGKKLHDKRETERARDADREIARAVRTR